MQQSHVTHQIRPLLHPTLTREARAAEIFQRVKHTPEPDLIRDLLGERHRELEMPPKSATPEGYHYVSRHSGQSQLIGSTLFLSPHPSDVSADFFPLLIRQIQALGGEYHQAVLTRGEEGDRLRPPAETIARRQSEEARSAQITGINVHYLTKKDGAPDLQANEYYFSDGQLLNELPELTARLKSYIEETKPRRLAIPSLYPDHPDHLATAIAALNAVLQLRDEGYFQTHGKIEILSSDPEFAIAAGQPWALQHILEIYGGNLAFTPNIALKFFEYRYALDQKGLVHPVDLTQEAKPTDLTFPHHVAVPPLILTASDEDERVKLQALLQHDTQTLGKPYAHLIPSVDRLRALQTGTQTTWATALYPIELEGVTTREHSLIDALPQGHVFQLQQMQAPNTPTEHTIG